MAFQVQTSKIITSYAISPQAIFTCPPCSIRYRRHGAEAPRRFTYCSVTSPNPQLVRFSESSCIKSSLGEEIETTSISLGHKANPVIHVDTFLVLEEKDDDATENKILAVHEDGMVACYSKDLGVQEWSTNINSSSSNGDTAASAYVEHAAILSIEQARKAILKGREDILATLGTDSDDLGASLLFVITRSKPVEDPREHRSLMLKIFTIKAVKSKSNMLSGSARQNLQDLITQVIPEPGHLQSKYSKFTFHATFKTLFQISEETLVVYNLAGSIPQLEHEHYLPEAVSSCLQLSPNLLAYAAPASVSIVDLPYYSLQAKRSLTEDDEALFITQKPKNQRDKPAKKGNLRVLSYFTPLDIVVALDGRKLLVFQLSTTTVQISGPRKRKRDGLLVNSISNGPSLMRSNPSNQVASDRQFKPLGSPLASPLNDPAWSAQKAELDRYSSQLKVDQFEKTTARALGLELKKGNSIRLQSPNSALLDLQKVYYLLSRIFSLNETKETTKHEASADATKQLTMRFLPRRICGWLVKAGLFTTHHVEKSLKHHGGLPFTSKLSTGALMHALAERDTSLELVSSVLASPVPLSSGELVHILAIITCGTERLKIGGNGGLPTNGDLASRSSSVNGNIMQLTNGENSSSLTPIFASEASHHHILSLTLRRLYACLSSSVARALKKELSTAQLRLLIDELRMEIARNGWLSPYDDSLEATEPDLPDSNQLCHIAHLLNCAVDSIGTGGWILATSMTDDMNEAADTLAYMRAEISAALEGIEEAIYLKGVLGEILLCGKNALHSSTKPQRPNQNQLTAPPVKPISIALNEENSSLLPLGLKTAPVISTTKVGAGGELIKRSARDIGRLKSKMVGKYSFDRIVV